MVRSSQIAGFYMEELLTSSIASWKITVVHGKIAHRWTFS